MSEDDYAAVASWRDEPSFTAREKVAIEYAELFATNHLAMDDDFWQRLRSEWTDEEVLDLAVCVASWLGMGRLTQVFQPQQDCPVEL